MVIIALDSSGATATVAIAREDAVLAEYSLNNGLTHSQTMLPMLDEITRRLGLEMSEVDAVAVAKGPGSFTGLRIGSATAKGIGLALDRPVVGVPTLEALAWNVCGTDMLVCPMMNARRNQVYTALYRFSEEKEGQFRTETVAEQTAEDLVEWCGKINDLGQPVMLLGDGADDFREILTRELTVPFRFAPFHLSRPRAGALACCAVNYLREGKIETAAEHAPVYLRKSQAEREREKKLCQKETETV